MCVFYYGKILFVEIPHFVWDDNISIFLVEKSAAKPPFSLPNHNNKCHSECSEAKWGICNFTTMCFIYIFDVFIYDNIMISGLSPDDYNVKKRRGEETAMCVFYYGKMLFDEIPHFVRDDNISIFLVEKRAAKPPFSLPNHNNKCHSEWSEAKWGICNLLYCNQ